MKKLPYSHRFRKQKKRDIVKQYRNNITYFNNSNGFKKKLTNSFTII